MKHNKYLGFTLIEIMLVLAIGGMILAMVFIALPGLLASQRDAQRQDDLMAFVGQLQKFMTNNNRGALPSGTGEISGDSVTFGPNSGTTWRDFYGGFMNENFRDPKTGDIYNLSIVPCGTSKPGDCTHSSLSKLYGDFEDNNSTIRIVTGAVCGENKAIYSSNPRNVAILYKLERAEAVSCKKLGLV